MRAVFPGTAASRPAGHAASRRLLTLEFEVIQVQWPGPSLAWADKVWQHVRPAPLPARLALAWEANGMRLGIASPHAMPAIRALIEQSENVVTSVHHMPRLDAHPWAIQTDAVRPQRTVFFFHPDGSMEGLTLSDAQALLRIEDTWPIDTSAPVTVTITPELRQQQSHRQWRMTPEGPREVVVHEGRVFAELAATVTLQPGEYLVVAPGWEPGRRYRLGHTLLEGEADARTICRMVLLRAKVGRLGRPD